MKSTKVLLTIDQIISEGIELKKIAIETNNEDLIEMFNEIESDIEEIIEIGERLNKQ